MCRASKSAWLAIGLMVGFATCRSGVAIPAEPRAETPASVSAEAVRILAMAAAPGGLAVQVGGSRPELTVAMREAARKQAGNADTWLFHVLDRDRQRVARARTYFHDRGVYGPISVDHWFSASQAERGKLPYADNLVNLLIVEPGQAVPPEEINRVLTPGGVACILGEDGPHRVDKPWPATIDHWTHTLHDASNNAVAADTVVGRPDRIQWVADPRNSRHHERLASITSVVSAGGRLFAIVDRAPTASVLLRPNWAVIARDAFNGIELWKRPIPTWESHLRPFRMGPPRLGRRLVASTDDRVYVTLGLDAPVTALDARTGRTLYTFEGTEGTEEILLDGDVLYLVVVEAGGKLPARTATTTATATATATAKRIMAVRAGDGKMLWQTGTVRPLPVSLAVGSERVYYVDPAGLTALDLHSGKVVWHADREVAVRRPSWSCPTVVVSDGVVLCADRQAEPAGNFDESLGRNIAGWLAENGYPGDLVAYAAADGKELWRCRAAETYHAQFDVFVIDGVVWYGQSRSRTGPDFTVGRDLKTGTIVHRTKTDRAWKTSMPHHRCYRNRATSNFLVVGRTGVELIEPATGQAWRHHWTRGTCQLGVLPCNGLLYVPPHACACYIGAKLTGFLAFAPPETSAASAASAAAAPIDDALRLYRAVDGQAVTLQQTTASDDDWPTYRHDAARSGRAGTTVPAELAVLWRARIAPAVAEETDGGARGGPSVLPRITAPVVAGGLALAASIDTHTVYAVDAVAGRPAWRFTAGGRVDSPPSTANGLAVFGSADGCVYCVRLADGHLVWKFHAAPYERRIVARGQVESAWPVHGAVLIQNADGPKPSVCFAAGRSSYVDGGIRLYRLDLATGRLLARATIDSRADADVDQPEEPIRFEMPGALTDVLSTDGDRVFMRRLALDSETLEPVESVPHLYASAGFLNGDWLHRAYWIFGDHFYSGYIGWYFAGRENAAGRILSIDEDRIFGFGYKPSFYRGSTGREYCLFGIDRATLPKVGRPDYDRANRDYPHGGGGKFKVQYTWQRDVPLLGRAMLVTGRGDERTVFLAGPPADAMRSILAYEGRRGVVLLAAAARDGHTRAQYALPALPVHDGMAAAGGRLYVSLEDGSLLCLHK